MIEKDRLVSLSIEVPDDIRNALEAQWGDLSRHLRENLALDGYRQGVLRLAQVRRLLGFSTRWDAQQFLASICLRGCRKGRSSDETIRAATLSEGAWRP